MKALLGLVVVTGLCSGTPVLVSGRVISEFDLITGPIRHFNFGGPNLSVSGDQLSLYPMIGHVQIGSLFDMNSDHLQSYVGFSANIAAGTISGTAIIRSGQFYNPGPILASQEFIGYLTDVRPAFFPYTGGTEYVFTATAPAPEPATWGLMGLALAGIALRAARNLLYSPGALGALPVRGEGSARPNL